MNYCQWFYGLGNDGSLNLEPGVRDLAIVNDSGVALPASFLVSRAVHESLFGTKTLSSALNGYLRGLSSKDGVKISKVAGEVRKHIVKTPFSKEVSASLAA